MPYTALARQWRPRSFEQLVGQDLIKQTLTSALAQQRLHHAYLFTGTHGTGKTTTARLFAKALSCEQGISATPCLTCTTCVSIDQGCFVDLLEIDGASKTRVEETRELLDNVSYAPVQGRFKIYLIDEVHMLSLHSCNALLKTLEEPPAHVKFLLATTDPQKLPVTVLSRCLQLHLKPIAETIIVEQLAAIVAHEQGTATPVALQIIAQAAGGSLRDALSLLEQAFACAGGSITESVVKSLLGYTQQDYVPQLLAALYTRQASACLAVSANIAAEGGHYTYVLSELMRALHHIACVQLLGTSGLDNRWQRFADAFAPETIQLFYQIALKGWKELPDAPSPVIGFEMTLLRLLAFQPEMSAPTQQETLTVDCAPDRVVEAPAQTNLPHDGDSTFSKPPPWHVWIRELALSGLVLHAAQHAALESLTDHICTLMIQEGHRSLFTPNVLRALSTALTQWCQRPITVTLQVQQAPVSETPARLQQQARVTQQQEMIQHLSTDPMFQASQQQFDGQWVPAEPQEG